MSTQPPVYDSIDELSTGPGRGSAAGSIVSYLLGITSVDPLAFDLLFERFLDPERDSPPDIDMDFADRDRSRVVDYIGERYGRERVTQIATFGRIGVKSGLRDVGRVLGFSPAELNRITSRVPPDVTRFAEIGAAPAAHELAGDPRGRRLLELAPRLEGFVRQPGVHPAAVVITPGPVSELLPVAQAKKVKGQKEPGLVTQYDMKAVESLGGLKLDVLGLRTLTIIDTCLQLIYEETGERIEPDDIPTDDRKALDLFRRGDTDAVFQFESDGMKEWLRKLLPTSIHDLVAMNALYRPGPMDNIQDYVDRRHGRQPVPSMHAYVDAVLKPTYGIPVYQEQVMEMVNTWGGRDRIPSRDSRSPAGRVPLLGPARESRSPAPSR